MFLVSITPGEVCAVRVYSCTLRAKRKVADWKFDRIPDAQEVRAMAINPTFFEQTQIDPPEAA